jgi:aspartate racemase
MRKIGLVGGLGPESTVDYYKGILGAFKEGYARDGFPEIVLDSLDLRAFVKSADEGRWEVIADMLVRSCERLEGAGAAFGAIASNTPHRVFGEVQARTRLPLVSIVSATVEHLRASGIRRVCFLATGFTMRADFYTGELRAAGITPFLPDDAEIDYVQRTLMDEIELGIVTPEARERFTAIARRVVAANACDGVVLACTELPLVIKPGDFDAAYVDTAAIHVAAIVERCRA